MDALSTPSSNGKTSGNKYLRHVFTFISPKIFWAAYGYWLSLACIVIFQDYGIFDSVLGFPDWLTAFRPELYKKIPFEFFLGLPGFFYQ